MKNKISRFISMSFLSVFIGLIIYYHNSTQIIGNKLPMPFGYGASIVLSGSMEPELSVDDLIIVKETNEYKIGDVVVFQHMGDLIVHRIIDIKDGMYQTQGDANNVADPYIGIEQLKGVVIKTIPAAGKVVNIIKSPIGVITILGSSFALLEISYRKEKNKESEELKMLKAEIEKIKKEL